LPAAADGVEMEGERTGEKHTERDRESLLCDDFGMSMNITSTKPCNGCKCEHIGDGAMLKANYC
jgi:hypothetical protein